jgi:Na+-driven multidrug efflux pump
MSAPATRRARFASTGALAAAGIVGAIGLLVATAPDLWLRLFLRPQDGAALAAARDYFRTVGPTYGSFAVGLALYFASQGAGRMLWPVAASVLRMIVAIGAALALGQAARLGPDGVYLGIAAGMLGIAAGMVAYGLFTAAAIGLTRWR